MAELKPCPKCGKIPEHRLFMKDIPEADRLYPAASLRCDCKAVQTVALTHKEALEFAEEIWNEYIEWCKTDEGKEYLEGGSKYKEVK